jgi:hypothetical protein
MHPYPLRDMPVARYGVDASLIGCTRCARVQLAQQLSRVTSLVKEMETILSASAIVG